MHRRSHYCNKRDHHGWHSSLKSLHKIECKGINAGFNRYKILTPDAREIISVLSEWYDISEVAVEFKS